MKAGLTVLLLLIFCTTGVHAQTIFQNWYFGKFAGLSFNSGSPVALTGGQTNQLEGCASISSATGSLLFYTDGVKVWDKNHAVMPNGTGLMGNWSSSQSALIVPRPGSSTQYYLFTVTDWMSNGDLRYSVVDMSLNNGNGDVIAASKNTWLSTGQTEKLVAANATNCGVWVITHQRDNSIFESRLVTSSGIGAPVTSNSGSVHTSVPTPPDNYNNLTGMMKVSPNNQKLGLATLARVIELFDFNPATGQLSNPIALPMIAPKQGYGVCFSPDNSKYYVTEGTSSSGGYDIFQFDLSSGNPTTIINSRTFVGRASLPIHIVGDMQIGPDGRIYFTRMETGFLGVIPNPNLAAPGCGFINNGVSLGAGISQAGLPGEIRTGSSGITLDLGADTLLCTNESLTLTSPTATTYAWSTGASTPSITISSTGQYWLTISNGACFASDTINVVFTNPDANLGNDTSLCQGQSVILNGGTASSYLWSNGAVSSTINVSTPGQYWVRLTNGNCFEYDTVNVSFTAFPDVQLGNDTSLCQGQSITLSGGTASGYLWSNGAITPSIIVSTAGQYWAQLANGGCSKADTINITYAPVPNANLGNDTTLCQGQTIVLNAGTATGFLWSTGATTATINTGVPGQYWVQLANGSCSAADTVNIMVAPIPIASLGVDSNLCAGQSLMLNGGTASNYLWSTGATSPGINVSNAGQYWVKLSNGNCSSVDTINITYSIPPPRNFPPAIDLCIGQFLTLDAGPGKAYAWSNGDTTRVLPVTASGNYGVEIIYGNACTVQYGTIIRSVNCECEVMMPDAFTPNRDGLNDVFKPAQRTGCEMVSFSVYNRWGQKVFESQDQNKGWDGTVAGKIQATGVFVWQIILLKDGKKIHSKGTVTLIR